jgi:hypothetical protein
MQKSGDGMRIKRISIFIGLAAIAAFATSAQAINSKAGTAAYTFLKEGTGAKAQALGGAFVGLADDATALYYNPAGLVASAPESQQYDELLEKPINPVPPNRFTASYINYLVDFQYGFLGYIRDIDSATAIGASVAYQNYGSFKRLDRDGTELGTFGASDFAFGLTYAKRFVPKFSMAITGKFIYEKIDTYSSNGLAADIGLMYLVTPDGSTRLGLALTNLGAQLKGLSENHKDNLPTKIAAGISHKLKGLPFLFSGEVGKPFDNDVYGALGMELVSLKPFYIRLGWTTQAKDWKTGADNDGLAGFAGGFGFTYKAYQIDYSYSSMAGVGSVHRVTVEAGF